MGLTGSIVLAILGLVATLLVAILARLLADDVKAWVPRLTRHAIQRAVRKLPYDQRDRLAEEWTAGVADTPGDLSKLIFACGLMCASRKIVRYQQRCIPSPAKPEAKVIYADWGVQIELNATCTAAASVPADATGATIH